MVIQLPELIRFADKLLKRPLGMLLVVADLAVLAREHDPKLTVAALGFDLFDKPLQHLDELGLLTLLRCIYC